MYNNLLVIKVPSKKVEKIKYFSTLLGLIFIEITRGPFSNKNYPSVYCADVCIQLYAYTKEIKL